MQRIVEYEIVDHGIEHEQYFQGCGVALTNFDDVATGIGMDAKEAYEDAVENLAQGDWDVERLPKRPRGINKKNKVGARMGDEVYYYVSVRVRGKGE